MITVLGTGLLGAGFARALVRRGEVVHVWNRTASKARAIEGAVAFDDPADAVRGATRIHVVLSDDAAVDAVLDAAKPTAPIFDHTTTSTAGAIERTARFRERGVTYLHAPVFMGPSNALESTGLMLVSGDRAVVASAQPLLAPMTGQLVDLGERVDAAAAFKLLGNLLLMALTAGFTDMLGLGKAMGVAPAEVATLLQHFNPGASLPARFARLISAPYDDPSWELAMARKDARLVLDECARAGVQLPTLPAITAHMDEMIARGFGNVDWTVLARDFLVT
jgi:3-hydroxyisobutyrate dehydrogenase